MNVLSRMVLCAVVSGGVSAGARAEHVRIAAFNVHDLNAEEVRDAENARVQRLAEVIEAVDADILLLSEVDAPVRITMDIQPSVGELLVKHYLEPRGMRYTAYAISSNTGVHSGHDLDNNGINDPGSAGRDYGGDCYGFGVYPGQYAMLLLVREGIEADWLDARTFQMFRWKDMPGALIPDGMEGRSAWYDAEEASALRLSSKNHVDVPVRLKDGRVLHVLCSHPTPPVFDGDEDRNGRRNHDEIRFWGDYVSGAGYMTDDAGVRGGLDDGAAFVVLGDLNADPEKGDSREDPVGTYLLGNPKIDGGTAPRSVCGVDRLEATDTCRFRMRVDYVLPSKGLGVVGRGLWRGPADSEGGAGGAMADFPSDHYPVWVDIAVEASGGGDGGTGE